MLSEPFWVIVPAAGRGIRAGVDVPKQHQLLGDKTVLEWTVFRLLQFSDVSGIVVAVPPEELRDPQCELGSSGLRRLSRPDRPVLLTPGGNTRQESVYNALAAIPQDVKWIGVHDAARPCFSADLLSRVWMAAKDGGAAICALKPTDTVKVVRGSTFQVGPSGAPAPAAAWVDSTLNRDVLVGVQTPQVFEADLLRRAHHAARNSGLSGTDDSQLVEALGHPVAVVPGERGNLKITYSGDFDIAIKRLVPADSRRPYVRRRFSRRSGIRGSRGLTRCESQASRVSEARIEPKETPPSRNSEAPEVVSGLGFDIHPLAVGRKCVLGGVLIPSDRGPLGHSDGDVLCHAVMDAVLGALGKGDIGVWFPPDDPQYEGASSIGLMRDMWKRLMTEATIVHIDATVIAETPKIAPFYGAIKAAIGSALVIQPKQISIKATTAERLGAIGREEGIAAFAVATMLKRE
ncbi:MAG: 2-C-methyl-D-erythritol 4-phosphate cytidylyltransferase [Prolixibacteraceae bacterium]|nr:2-C-methyl-D-erythritol 4-phosphate cytidylyltransferase [Prolixibacteraceae bacterium]